MPRPPFTTPPSSRPPPAPAASPSCRAPCTTRSTPSCGRPYEPLVSAPRSRPGDSTAAAVAAATHDTLLWLFPGQAESLNARYDEALAAIPDGRAEDGGVAVGRAAAAAMTESRRDDGFDPTAPWTVGTEPGEYRLTPPGYVNVGAWVPNLKPFVVPDAACLPGQAPPTLTGAAWARDLNEVKSLGAATSTVRTEDQTEAAIWWDDPRMVEWSITRQLADARRLSSLRTARLLAMVYVASADTLIACYKAKAHWNFWRPVTAIPLALHRRQRGHRSRPGLDAAAGHRPVAGVPVGPCLLHHGGHDGPGVVLRP